MAARRRDTHRDDAHADGADAEERNRGDGTVVVDPDRGFARAVLGATDGAPLMLPAVAERLATSGADGFGIDEAKQAIADAGASFDSYLTQIHAVALSRAAKGAFAQ